MILYFISFIMKVQESIYSEKNWEIFLHVITIFFDNDYLTPKKRKHLSSIFRKRIKLEEVWQYTKYE